MSLERVRTRYIYLATAFLGAALLITGCKHSPAPGVRNSDGSITNADGSITYPPGTITPAAQSSAPVKNPDGSTTNPDGSVTYPADSARAEQAKEGQSAPPPTPVTTQSPAQQPAPTPAAQPAPPPPPPPVAKVIPNGTPILVTITQTLRASTNNAGDGFSGVLRRNVTTPKGDVVFPRGTEVRGVVAAAKGKGRFKGSGDLAIELTSMGGVRISTTEYEAVGKGRGKRTAGFIGGGTGLGAIIGGLAGGGKGAAIGALAGAGAGTAGAAYTGSRDVVIPSESSITFRLTESVTVH